MDLTILGEYGLKTALNVGLRLKKLYTSEVDDGIITAFEFALNDWSKHTPTSNDKVRLSKALEEYIQSSTSYEALDADTQTFIDCFKKRLSEQTVAHNYLMTLRADMQAKSEEQNLLEHHKTQESVLDLKSRMEELNMAPQYIRALLKELPLEQGLECTELALEDMLANGRIHSEGAKRLVLEFARFLFEHTDKISEEVKRLRKAGDSYLAETLEDIKRVLTGESKQSLTAVYEKYQDQAQQKEIRLLEELIEAAQIKFSFGEARKFYERLIGLAPTIEHRFNYACLLQSLNDFDKAKCLYEQVLHQLKELSEQNPELHKPKLAITLNNLGYLLSDINDLKQAQDCYEAALKLYQELSEQNPEIYKPHFAGALNNLGGLCQKTQDLKQAQAYYEDALKLRQKLSDQNPEAYKPYVAMTLNDLGNLHTKTNDLKQAQACYTDALKLYKELSKENPEAYKPDVAMTLNNLGNLFRDTKELKQAKNYYIDALKLYQDLLDQNAEAYKPYVAGTLNNLGCLLSEVKDLRQAQSYYTDAFNLYKDLSDQNPEAYNPCMAMTLNNLGNLFSEAKDLKQAQSYYMAAFKLYKDLSDQNSEAYKPYVAMTLNNLILLCLGLGKKKEAENSYQEAHDIYQDLASRHPRAYGIDYAKLLVMGFALLSKPKEELEKAKAILDKYPEHPKAQELLSTIKELANR